MITFQGQFAQFPQAILNLPFYFSVCNIRTNWDNKLLTIIWVLSVYNSRFYCLWVILRCGCHFFSAVERFMRYCFTSTLTLITQQIEFENILGIFSLRFQLIFTLFSAWSEPNLYGTFFYFVHKSHMDKNVCTAFIENCVEPLESVFATIRFFISYCFGQSVSIALFVMVFAVFSSNGRLIIKFIPFISHRVHYYSYNSESLCILRRWMSTIFKCSDHSIWFIYRLDNRHSWFYWANMTFNILYCCYQQWFKKRHVFIKSKLLITTKKILFEFKPEFGHNFGYIGEIRN